MEQVCGRISRVCEPSSSDGGEATADLSEVQDLAVDQAMAIRRWPRRFGGTGADSVTALAASSSGDLYVAGSFTGSINFAGPGIMGEACADLMAKGGQDALLAKYSAAGSCLWAFSFGSSKEDAITSVASDGKDRAIITGSFQETVAIGIGTSCSLTAAPMVGREVFLAVIDAKGGCVFAKSFGGPQDDSGTAVAVDAADNILLTGYFQDTIDLGTGVIGGGGSADVFVAKFDSTGKTLDARVFGGSGPDVPAAIAVDGAGRVALAGRYRSVVNFCGSSIGANRTMNIAFVFELNEDLSCLRAQEFVSSVESRGSVLSATAGGLIVAGTFKTQLQIGGNLYVENGTAKQGDVFVARLNAGRPEWSLAFGGTNADDVSAITFDKASNPILVGSFSDRLTLPGGRSLSSAPAGSADGFAIRLGLSAGDVLGAQKFGGPGEDGANAAIAVGDSLFFGGAFQLDWGSLKNAGDADGFIVEAMTTF